MQSANWIAVLIGFLGGSVFSSILGGIYAWLSRPILSVRLVRGKGCYVTTSRGNPPTHQARFLRLLIENVGLSAVKGCAGYIVSIRKTASGISQPVEQEVVELAWTGSSGPRDIPRGAFFYLGLASLDLTLPNRMLGLVVNWMPNHLAPLLADTGTFELEIIVAAENAKPVRRTIRFEFDPQQSDLTFRYDS